MTIKQKYVIIYADKSKGEKIMKKIEISKMNGELGKHQIVTIADAYSNEFFKGERFVTRAITYLSIHKNSSKIFNADLNNLFTNKEQLEKFFKKYYKNFLEEIEKENQNFFYKISKLENPHNKFVRILLCRVRDNKDGSYDIRRYIGRNELEEYEKPKMETRRETLEELKKKIAPKIKNIANPGIDFESNDNLYVRLSKETFPLFIKEVMVKLELQGAFEEEYEIIPAEEVDLKEVF